MPRTTSSIFTPAWLALYSARMIFGIGQRVELGHDVRRLAVGRRRGFAGDHVEQGLLQGERRMQQFLHAQGLTHADQLS